MNPGSGERLAVINLSASSKLPGPGQYDQPSFVGRNSPSITFKQRVDY